MSVPAEEKPVLIDRDMARRLLPPRDPMGHKGTFGRVCVYGGAVGYTGAPVFAAEAAVRCGSGLVTALVPRAVYPIAAARCVCAMAKPAPEDCSGLLGELSAADAAVIGPGLGRGEETERGVLSLLTALETPVVLDADGINAAAAHIDVLTGRRYPTVVTPHEGEFRRLGGDLTRGRRHAAADFARRHGCVLVLKGPGTIVAAPDGRLAENTTGNDGCAKGGSGDVLAGMIASLLGQGAPLWEAACCAVWLHGRAADLCRDRYTAYAMNPADMIACLPDVFRELVE